MGSFLSLFFVLITSTETQTLFLLLSSLVAMLEAFVYDPLISWRLLDQSTDEVGNEVSGTESQEVVGGTITSLPLDAHNVASVLPEPIQEEQDEDGEDDDDEEGDDEDGDGEDQDSKGETENGGNPETNLGSSPLLADASSLGALTAPKPSIISGTPYSTSHAKSLQMYSEMRALAANLSTSSRIASITGGGSLSAADSTFGQGSTTARSRIDKSIRQREQLLSVVDDEGSSSANEDALNERALKVIRRVQDKLTGTDFHTLNEELAGEPLDVQEQVQRLIVQATSSENLCQLFIGWCAFW